MKKLKTVLCTVLALAMMFAVLVIPASAASSNAKVIITGDNEITGDPDQEYNWQILDVGQKEKIYATVQPSSEAANVDYVWWTVGSANASNPLIGTILEAINPDAKLNAGGKAYCEVEGKQVGTDSITVHVRFKDGTVKTATEGLTVFSRVYIRTITLKDQESHTFYNGGVKITATTTSSEWGRQPTDPTLVWTSSEPGIASVDQNGNVKGISPGKTIITATAKDHAAGTTAPSGTAIVYVDGKESFTGFYKEADGGWYWYDNGVKNATSKSPYTGAIYGTVEGKAGWWRTVNGKADTAYTGLTYFTAKPGQNGGGWWYFENGYITGKWTGFVTNAAGTWYVKNSQVNFKETGVVYNPLDGNWYFVKNSKLTPGPDVEPNAAGWWYIDKTGKVDFTKTGVEHNAAGWWRIENGKVNFNFNGLASNSAGTWVIKNGKVNFNYNGKYNYKGHTYNIKNGKVV